MSAPPSNAAAVDDLRFESIIEFAGLAESYARSAAEAAWRGERITLGVHLAQLRLATISALETLREISACPGETGSAA